MIQTVVYVLWIVGFAAVLWVTVFAALYAGVLLVRMWRDSVAKKKEEKLVEELVALDVAASYEYPGYVNVEIPDGRYMVFDYQRDDGASRLVGTLRSEDGEDDLAYYDADDKPVNMTDAAWVRSLVVDAME